MRKRYEVDVEFHGDFVRVEGGKRIIVGLLSRPEKGKANRELIEKLARYFKVSSSRVRIISGLRSRRKVVEIEMDV